MTYEIMTQDTKPSTHRTIDDGTKIPGIRPQQVEGYTYAAFYGSGNRQLRLEPMVDCGCETSGSVPHYLEAGGYAPGYRSGNGS